MPLAGGYLFRIMADVVMVQPNGPDQVVGFCRHQNPLINTAAIRVEYLQPIDERQVEAGMVKVINSP